MDIVFDACVYHVAANGTGALAQNLGSTDIVIGASSSHFLALAMGQIQCGARKQVFVGNPNIGIFANLTRMALLVCEVMTWVGPAQGSQYNINTGSSIYAGGWQSSFPGNSAGSGGTTTGGGFLV